MTIFFIAVALIMIIFTQILQRKSMNLIDKRLSRDIAELWKMCDENRRELRDMRMKIK